MNSAKEGINLLNNVLSTEGSKGLFLATKPRDNSKKKKRKFVRVVGAYAKGAKRAALQFHFYDETKPDGSTAPVKHCSTVKDAKMCLELAEAAYPQGVKGCSECNTVEKLAIFGKSKMLNQHYGQLFPFIGKCKKCGSGEVEFKPSPDDDLIVSDNKGQPRLFNGEVIGATKILETMLSGNAAKKDAAGNVVYDKAFQPMLRAALGSDPSGTSSLDLLAGAAKAHHQQAGQSNQRQQPAQQRSNGFQQGSLFSPSLINLVGTPSAWNSFPVMSPMFSPHMHQIMMRAHSNEAAAAAGQPPFGQIAASAEAQPPTTMPSNTMPPIPPPVTSLSELSNQIPREKIAAALTLLRQQPAPFNNWPGQSLNSHMTPSFNEQSQGPVEPHLKDEILDMKCTELNKYIKQNHLSAEKISEIKKERRKKKNRIYAKRSRDRKNQRERELQEKLDKLQQAVTTNATSASA
eukprot:m.336302 g.336302  ORF g.336302 m.336302 type:complete len:461 (+) comp17809_c0_seq1:242-1624(+)